MEDILANIPGVDISKEMPAEDKTDLWIVLTNWVVVVIVALAIWGKS